jgi:hypothetical protein
MGSGGVTVGGRTERRFHLVALDRRFLWIARQFELPAWSLV